MSAVVAWGAGLLVVVGGTFFFVIIGVFGVPVSLAGLLLFVAVALALFGRLQQVEKSP